MDKSIILANGRSPKKSLITKLQRLGYNYLICADGGANTAYKMKLVPDLIIGDLDSISETTYKFYEKKCTIKKITRQNDTDVEKALKYAISKKHKEVLLIGATGDRLDHSFCNLGIVLKFFNKLSIKVIHENTILTAVKGKYDIFTIPGEFLSLYGFDNKTKFFSKGLKYPLKNISLKFGERESTSNQSISEIVHLNVRGGVGFLVRDLNKALSCDFV